MRVLWLAALGLGCTVQIDVIAVPFDVGVRLDASEVEADAQPGDLPAGDGAPTTPDAPPTSELPVGCEDGRVRCGGACVRTDRDPAHCGDCGRACRAGVGCTEGRCDDAVIDLALGESHLCALRGNGEVACWGNNDFGQLGDGSINNRAVPTPVMGIFGARHVDVRQSHSCVVATAARELLCWGNNSRGQLGNGGRDDSVLPVLVTGSRGATTVSIGQEFSCFAAGQVWCWGDNAQGQLGDGTLMPRRLAGPVADLDMVAEVAAGGTHACALRDGRVYCWGEGHDGRLGQGEGAMLRATRPVEVPGLRGVAQLAVGAYHACARVRGDGVWCWGSNNNGQLGDGTFVSRGAPTRVAEPELLEAKWIVAAPGGFHTCALDGRGGLWCWGNNEGGQVGDGSTAIRVPLPARVRVPAEAEPMERIRLGAQASCSISARDGGVWCWGQLGWILPSAGVGAQRTPRRLPWFGP